MAKGMDLSIRKATKYYGSFKAVDSISLDVRKGEFLTILGPSGSGKTSLLKLIAGFEEVSSGAIYLNDQDITKKKPYERDIGMVFQNYALFPHMTVAENIAYPLTLRKVPKHEIRERVQRVLDMVHMEHLGSRYPKQLSGGQQQRVAIARAIVFNPPLLLLDEPLGALDKNLRERMQLEIKHIQEKIGITTISVTHDQEEALTMSDRICVMNHGRIEQVSSPEELYQLPCNRFVAEFIGEINLLGGEVTKRDRDSSVVRLLDDTSVVFYAHGTKPEQEKVFIALRPENIHLARESGEFENTLLVQVQEKIYLGESIKLKAKTAFDQEMTVRVPVANAAQLAIGQEILLGWSRADMITIPYEADAS
ncbi:ABC transporter ATP-binding protein [Aneurinibacillus danicus]|uniref:Spermidine/putrescine import ATP-binding protein PotA n=1 Tax=Aneurinibacillus danicus TaxID=267746 RepID=A0A511V8F8_9BACL|nr:ABC transporter ATP-binding protein [Aneurinibacillus danicus]GEN33482.1 polyamine-transporting ATPase [Aneurinibacillus danicus]